MRWELIVAHRGVGGWGRERGRPVVRIDATQRVIFNCRGVPANHRKHEGSGKWRNLSIIPLGTGRASGCRIAKTSHGFFSRSSVPPFPRDVCMRWVKSQRNLRKLRSRLRTGVFPHFLGAGCSTGSLSNQRQQAGSGRILRVIYGSRPEASAAEHRIDPRSSASRATKSGDPVLRSAAPPGLTDIKTSRNPTASRTRRLFPPRDRRYPSPVDPLFSAEDRNAVEEFTLSRKCQSSLPAPVHVPTWR